MYTLAEQVVHWFRKKEKERWEEPAYLRQDVVHGLRGLGVVAAEDAQDLQELDLQERVRVVSRVGRSR